MTATGAGAVARRFIWVGPAIVVASVIAVVIVQQIALRLLFWPRGSPLSGNEPAIFTAVLVSGAVVVFLAVLHEAANPVRTFRRIAFVALVVSVVPDIALGLSSIRWASWPLAITFIVMHAVAWAVTVAMLTGLATSSTHRTFRTDSQP